MFPNVGITFNISILWSFHEAPLCVFHKNHYSQKAAPTFRSCLINQAQYSIHKLSIVLIGTIQYCKQWKPSQNDSYTKTLFSLLSELHRITSRQIVLVCIYEDEINKQNLCTYVLIEEYMLTNIIFFHTFLLIT